MAFSRSFYAGTWNEVTYNVTVSTNSTLANFNFTDKQVKFDITGYMSSADSGFCNVTIPKNLLRCDSLYDWQVLLNGASIAYTPNQNATHTFIYFTHGYSIQNVQIIGTDAIPEFPTWTSTLLILIVLTVAIAIYKRRPLKTPTH